MSWTATTTTLTKSTLDFIGNLKGTHADIFYCYVQYTKGDETAATLSLSFIDDRISATTQFKGAVKDTATVAQLVFTVTGTQNVCIPISVPPDASHIVLALSHTGSTPTGTIAIDGFPAISG